MVVVDASALLAALLFEAGGERVRAVRNPVIGAVNLAEVVERLQRDVSDDAVLRAIAAIEVAVIAVDSGLAIAAGLFGAATRSAGLSLGDRCCLALARQLGCPALTADRAWLKIAGAVGVEVQLIR